MSSHDSCVKCTSDYLQLTPVSKLHVLLLGLPNLVPSHSCSVQGLPASIIHIAREKLHTYIATAVRTQSADPASIILYQT